ncbi:hypothetical protein CEXT_588621 [Caerostris extrusa]|uniref:Uncharacterized protein n=1 Tax=Caerostris extrusa TaxID=172846 RepID=A0AAV4XVU8_CAEEX|nr:hypothetical protein CEXT_588621 [Caerostris extrusa]
MQASIYLNRQEELRLKTSFDFLKHNEISFNENERACTERRFTLPFATVNSAQLKEFRKQAAVNDFEMTMARLRMQLFGRMVDQ